MSDVPLILDLLAPGAELPDAGRPLRAISPASASLEHMDDALLMRVVLPDRDLSESRWVVDGLCRKLAESYPIGALVVRAADDLPDGTVLSLCLDRHLASKGRLEVEGRPSIARSLSAHADSLTTYCQWVDEDPADRTSIAIARDVSRWAEPRTDVEVEVLDAADLSSRGLALLCAVGQASASSPPRLVIARYRSGDPRPPRMLLGKGITFDTGGINVKPYESFVSMMKNDMAGAALAWSLFKTAVEQGSEEPLALVIPTCENPVGEGAMRPGALVRSYRGHVVRIDHTDAEGRLILADALAYAADTLGPSQVISFATLTTAALVAYGPYATPVHFADPETQRRLVEASEALGEDLHFFPERLWHLEANRDKEADLRNTARLPGHAQGGAGSRNAAHFLKHFADVPLVHFDIFGSTWNWAGDAPGAGPGATGAPLRTLVRAYAGI